MVVSPGFSAFVSDQRPSPAALTARTCTSYSTSKVSPPISAVSGPAVQASCTTVHSSSDLSVASLRM